jgi:hypothetical protein
MDNTCVIIGSYVQNHLDSSLLGLTVESWASFGYDICLVSHSPINVEIQKEVKYYIYSDENEMLVFPKPSTTYWQYRSDTLLYHTNWMNGLGKHSYSILKNMQNALCLLKDKGYKNFVYVEVDGFLNNQDHDNLKLKFNEIKLDTINYWFIGLKPDMVVSNFFAGNVEFFYKNLIEFDTPEKYISQCSKYRDSYTMESFLATIISDFGSNTGIVEQDKNIHDFINSKWFGISGGGSVSVPELKSKSWWIDLVRSNDTDSHIYFIISACPFEFNTEIYVYKNNSLVSKFNHETRAWITWFRFDVEDLNEVWCVEQKFGNKVIKTISASSNDIINNYPSFLQVF